MSDSNDKDKRCFEFGATFFEEIVDKIKTKGQFFVKESARNKLGRGIYLKKQCGAKFKQLFVVNIFGR